MAVIGILFGVLLWLILTPLMIAFAYVLSFWGARSQVRNNPHALGPITYQFSENGHTYAAANGKGEVLWAAYPKIYETRDSFLLFFVKNLAKVLPKRCFAGQPAIKDLKGLLEKNYKGELRLVK